ncbi:MAG: hypothetical protein KIT45_06355 [Fimbriimonadia bacterium]|nr:hypothetical protein [Fimbriimonadia bacterium]
MAWTIVEDSLRMRERFVLVVQTDTVWEAAWLKSMLIASRIQAIEVPAGLSAIIARGEVWVPLEKREAAIQVLKELEDSAPVSDDWHEEVPS